MVIPKESAHFGFWDNANPDVIVNLKDSEMYTEDWIGLRSLDEAGKLKLLEVEGDHLQFDLEWLHEQITLPYLEDQVEVPELKNDSELFIIQE